MKYVALITGGSRGIGLGIAKALVKEGYRVAINGVRPIQQIKETLNDLKADGGEVIYCQGDIGNSVERKKIVDEIKNQWGHLHVLVNNAGIAPHERKDILEADEKSFDADSYAHYLHHKYFECNYADGILPLDRWFGTLHDGSDESQYRLSERLKKRNRRKIHT